MNKTLKHTVSLIVILVAINFLSNCIYLRIDLTQDKRYTLNPAVIEILQDLKSPLVIDIFLEGDNFPSEFRRLQRETNSLLKEFARVNNHIVFNIINPLENLQNRDRNIQQLSQRGLTPMQLSVQEQNTATQAIVFPWALASYNNRTKKIPLIKNKIGDSQQALVSNSVQHLQYAFADGISKLIKPKRHKIAILKGNKQLEDKYIADFIKKIGAYYFIAPFTLDSVATNPHKTLSELQTFDLIISAKPTETFTEKEKLVLDQYLMQGGKSLWLVDAVKMDKEDLYNESGKNFALARDLNLTDFFFSYGIRINPVLVSTLFSAPITLAIGEGSQSQFQNLRWPYSPLVSADNKHPISHNLNLVKLDFANQIDTLKNTVKKTILLKTARQAKVEGIPREINLDLVTKEQNPLTFNKGNQTVAVLLEGTFNSVYAHRIKPFKLAKEIKISKPTKMIVVSDGDLIKNEVVKNKPQELGFDKWTGQSYGNKDFLLNAVNFLLDEDGLINIRSKEVTIAFLNRQQIAKEKTKWRLINNALPLALVGILGFVFNYFRKKKYTS